MKLEPWKAALTVVQPDWVLGPVWLGDAYLPEGVPDHSVCLRKDGLTGLAQALSCVGCSFAALEP